MKPSKLYKMLSNTIDSKQSFVISPLGNKPSSDDIKIISDPMITYYGFVDAFNIAKKQGKFIMGKYDNVSYKFYVVEVA